MPWRAIVNTLVNLFLTCDSVDFSVEFCFTRSEVLKAVKVSMAVFWVMTPYGLEGRYQRFREPGPYHRGSLLSRNVGNHL